MTPCAPVGQTGVRSNIENWVALGEEEGLTMYIQPGSGPSYGWDPMKGFIGYKCDAYLHIPSSH